MEHGRSELPSDHADFSVVAFYVGDLNHVMHMKAKADLGFLAEI